MTPEPPTADRPRDVLVVEDDTKLAAVIVRACERAGFTCRTATSGDQALWAINDGRPDALVLDIMIPHPSGIEVCRHLRNIGYDGPIVAISARSGPDDQAAAQRAGADRFLAKPFALADLVGRLDELLLGHP
ncbi:MAG TPA: response regulator transcription factor [Acidimicrobiales bacterium]